MSRGPGSPGQPSKIVPLLWAAVTVPCPWAHEDLATPVLFGYTVAIDEMPYLCCTHGARQLNVFINIVVVKDIGLFAALPLLLSSIKI